MTTASSPLRVHSSGESARLLDTIVCPHCWHEFPPEKLHFIATSPGLSYDHRIPNGGMRRFLPTRFTITGDAIDPNGRPATETACPDCHLKVPRLLAIRRTLSFSIFGAPSSGKSYLIAAMTHMLNENLGELGLRIDDVDAEANVVIHDYERQLFGKPNPDSHVVLAKTDLVGDWYSEVVYGLERRQLPKPFLFRVEPTEDHPLVERRNDLSKVVVLYDNAGESFEPGGESERNPVTRHMAKAAGLIFAFDPTQEAAFRSACGEASGDPQWKDSRRSRQQTLFSEAISRVLRFRGMNPTDRLSVPLIVAVLKFDAWAGLMKAEKLPPFVRQIMSGNGDHRRQINSAYDASVVEHVSRVCRGMLARHARPMLERIESTCDPSLVWYVPVSATGGSPEGRDEAGSYFHLAGKIRPMWAEVPLLQMLHACRTGLVPSFRKKEASSQ